MNLRSLLLIAALGVTALPPSADAQGRGRNHGREQDVAFEATREGRIMPLRMIESRIVPRMRGADYLGPEFDPRAGIYRLKFMRQGRVIWVDVDARTGQVVGKSGD